MTPPRQRAVILVESSNLFGFGAKNDVRSHARVASSECRCSGYLEDGDSRAGRNYGATVCVCVWRSCPAWRSDPRLHKPFSCCILSVPSSTWSDASLKTLPRPFSCHPWSSTSSQLHSSQHLCVIPAPLTAPPKSPRSSTKLVREVSRRFPFVYITNITYRPAPSPRPGKPTAAGSVARVSVLCSASLLQPVAQ